MANRRPSPQQIAALKLEIDRRYRQQAKQTAKRNSRSRGMAAIRLSELTRWMEDAYGAGVELSMDHHSYMIARIFAHHIGALVDAPRRITKWIDVYAPWIKPRDLERLITETQDCPMRWGADKLGWKLRLTDAKRTELRIKTIGAMDCNRDQRQARAKSKRAERDKARKLAKRKAKGSPNI